MKRILLLCFQILFLFNFSNAQTVSWTQLGTNINADFLNGNGTMNAIVTDNQGNVYTAGSFVDSVSGNTYVAKWNGTNWSELGTGANALNTKGDILTIAIDTNSGVLYAAGEIKNSSNYWYVAKWNGTNWSELGTGNNTLNANAPIESIALDNNGNIYAAGGFTNIDGYQYVAKWNGTQWSELGTGSNALNANNYISTITVDKYNNIYAGGYFFKTISQNELYPEYSYVAKWNGINWSTLGGSITTFNNPITVITTDKNGYVYVGGEFLDSNNKTYIAKWNGTEWSSLGNLLFNDIPYSIVIDNIGNIYASGNALDNKNYEFMGRWIGNEWVEFPIESYPPEDTYPNNLAIDNLGNVYAAGRIWNGGPGWAVIKWTLQDLNTSIIKPSNTKSIAIYPNPSTGIIHLPDFMEDVQLNVYNILGESVAEDEIKKGESTFDMSNLSSGIYSLVFTGQNYSYAPVKWIKE